MSYQPPITKFYQPLIRRRREINEKAAVLAATAIRSGDLDTLKYLVSNKYPLDVNSCRLAAEYSHVHILKYLMKNTPEAFNFNIALKHADALELQRMKHGRGTNDTPVYTFLKSLTLREAFCVE